MTRSRLVIQLSIIFLNAWTASAKPHPQQSTAVTVSHVNHDSVLEAFNHRELEETCEPLQTVVNFSSLSEGKYVHKLKGIGIEALPRGDCTGSEKKAARVVDTQKKSECSPRMGPSESCDGSFLRSSAPIEIDTTKQVVPFFNCENLGRGILVPQDGSQCVEDCRSGGMINFKFPEMTLVRYLHFANVKEVNVTTILTLADGSVHSKIYKASTDGNIRGFELKVGSLSSEMSVSFGAGGVITEMALATPCTSLTMPTNMVDTITSPEDLERISDKELGVEIDGDEMMGGEKEEKDMKSEEDQIAMGDEDNNEMMVDDKENTDEDKDDMPTPSIELPKKCHDLIRQGKMENNPKSVWQGPNQTLKQVSGAGRQNSMALQSTGRSRTFHGPQQRIARKYIGNNACMVPGAVYELRAWVKLTDPITGNGVSCVEEEPAMATDVRKGEGLCPTFHIQVEDDQRTTRQLWAREYRDGWKEGEWNYLTAHFEVWQPSDDWSGKIMRMLVRINQMDPNLELLVDRVEFAKI